MWQAEAWHNEEFQNIVQWGTVAHSRLNDGAYLSDVAQDGRGEHTFTGFHPTPVAADGVDFAVVSQEAERLCQSPGREGIGTEAGVYQCYAAGEVGVCQIGEVASQLQWREHTFVDDVLRG